MNKRSLSLVLSLLFSMAGADHASENPHGELGIDCEACHTTTSWSDVEFSHEGVGFDLSRSHSRIRCDQCHDIKNFSGADRECRRCHLDVHESRMGSDCERCHVPIQWQIFDTEEIHARTRFPMMDRHLQIDCRNCHPDLIAGDFAISARDCVECHEVDYLSTTNPGHVSLGISTMCTECHEPLRWRPAFFPSHDVIFPIFSGQHREEWNLCLDCHPNPATFSVFSCFGCHSRQDMDDEHKEIQGYVYENRACFGCHPTGSTEDGVLEAHDSNFFPIFTGPHASTWQSCLDCHTVSGNFDLFSCLDCHEHDRASMDNSHQGITAYSYDSDQCLGCHPTGEKGEFRDHDPLYFPIYSGKHNEKWDDCTTCHIDPGDWSIFSCIDCHEHNQADMDKDHSEVEDYVYDSQACFDCHPTGEERTLWKKPRIAH